MVSPLSGLVPEVAPIAQLDRALVYGTSCRKFESSWARPLVSDETWMQLALAEADRAALLGEVPVGCLLVDADGSLLATGHNLRESSADPTAHAEMMAIRAAASQRGDWRLDGVTAYVTLEPCVMCAGALVLSRVERVVFGCTDPKAGAIVSLFTIGADTRLNHRYAVTGGVLAEDCAARLSDFFAALRAQGKK